MTMTTICRRCGAGGQIEGTGTSGDAPLSQLFRHRGHNPYSGDLHYQCPACGTVMLVDPVTVLESLTAGYPGTAPGAPGGNRGGKGKPPRGKSPLQRLFRNPRTA